MGYVTDAGRVMFEEMGALAAAAKLAGTVFEPAFDKHADAIWTAALSKRETGRVIVRMKGLEIRILKTTFGINFTDGKKCGYTVGAEYVEACEIAREDVLLEVNKTLIKK